MLRYPSLEGTGAGLQVTGVSCKPETRHSSSFRAGRAPPQQTPATGSQGKAPSMAHQHRLDSFHAKTWGNQKERAVWTPEVVSQLGARRAGAQQGGAPGHGQGWLLLILPDRKSGTNVRCPDRRRLRRSPRQRLRSRDGAARAGLSGALRVTAASARGWRGLGVGRGFLLRTQERRGFGGSQAKMLRLHS